MAEQDAVTDAKTVPLVILIGRNEAEINVLTLKKLATREQFENLTVEQAAEKILSEK